jgi:hypothetical protein
VERLRDVRERSWENVWGCWNGFVPADGEALRRVATLMRFLGAAGYLQSANWLPHYPVEQASLLCRTSPPDRPRGAQSGAGVFASLFPLAMQARYTHAEGRTLLLRLTRRVPNHAPAR